MGGMGVKMYRISNISDRPRPSPPRIRVECMIRKRARSFLLFLYTARNNYRRNPRIVVARNGRGRWVEGVRST
jgi:hypothetical protein